MKNSVLIKLLKKHTTIDEDFIDTFFKKFKIGGDLDFDIEDAKIAKYLGITVQSLRNRLLNQNSKNKNYLEKVDYIKIKSNKSNAGLIYMINYQCFERLAMSGDSKESETIRLYTHSRIHLESSILGPFGLVVMFQLYNLFLEDCECLQLFLCSIY